MSRAGRKSFESCDVKAVDFTRYDRNVENGMVYPENEHENDGDYQLNGFRGRLRCPRTVDDRIVIESPFRSSATPLEALVYVKKLAGELVCSDCRYASMTPVEVSIERKEFADAETERIKAYERLREARAEVDAIIQPALTAPETLVI